MPLLSNQTQSTVASIRKGRRRNGNCVQTVKKTERDVFCFFIYAMRFVLCFFEDQGKHFMRPKIVAKTTQLDSDKWKLLL